MTPTALVGTHKRPRPLRARHVLVIRFGRQPQGQRLIKRHGTEVTVELQEGMSWLRERRGKRVDITERTRGRKTGGLPGMERFSGAQEHLGRRVRRVSGSEDIIEDGVNGLLIEPEQPDQMAQALRRLIEDTELAQRLAREGYATILSKYQLSHAAEQCLEFYYQILGQNQNTKRRQ